MERPAYEKAVLFDSKKVAAKALSPVSTKNQLLKEQLTQSKNSIKFTDTETADDLAHTHKIEGEYSKAHLPK